MDNILVDPLDRRITLHARTWHGHILRGHPEMEPYRRLVANAIENPSSIRLSNSDPDCRLYFGSGPRSDIMVMVVVDVASGSVKTAHFARKLSGGREEWSSLTP